MFTKHIANSMPSCGYVIRCLMHFYVFYIDSAGWFEHLVHCILIFFIDINVKFRAKLFWNTEACQVHSKYTEILIESIQDVHWWLIGFALNFLVQNRIKWTLSKGLHKIASINNGNNRCNNNT